VAFLKLQFSRNHRFRTDNSCCNSWKGHSAFTWTTWCHRVSFTTACHLAMSVKI